MEIQTTLVDFSGCREFPNNYDGAAFKKPIEYEGARYFIKFGESLSENPKDPGRASFANTPLTEHLGSRCFELLGIESQKTILGVFDGEPVVACKDFVYEMGRTRYELVEFKKQERSVAGASSRIHKTPSFENIIEAFDGNHSLAPIAEEAEKRYWEMFVGDALLGNFDRHAGNWGYILDLDLQEFVGCAPVYDCGGCLTPKLSDAAMQKELRETGALDKRIFSYPSASLLVDGQRVKYHEFLTSEQGRRCRAVLADMAPRINIAALQDFFEKSVGMSPVQREFYSALVERRYELVVEPAIEMALSERSDRDNRSIRKPFSEKILRLNEQSAQIEAARQHHAPKTRTAEERER